MHPALASAAASLAVFADAQVLAEEGQDVVLKSVGYGTGMGAVGAVPGYGVPRYQRYLSFHGWFEM